MGSVLKGFIRDGRVEVDEPIDLPDGTEVLLTPHTTGGGDGPVTAAEVARILAAMRRLRPLEIPDDVAADLDAWERELNQHGIDRAEAGIEDAFR